MMVVATAFLVLERIAPGRELPHAPGWYGRAILINLAQVAITFATNRLWLDLLSGLSLFHLARLESSVLQGFIGWLVGTFFFYWWHRVRHLPGFWVVFHQVHHSPARIEALTAFYKHPVEILTDSALAAIVMHPLLGSSLEARFGSIFLPRRANCSITRTSGRRIGSDISSRLRSCTRSIISSTCITTITPTCRYGIGCSAPIAMPTHLPRIAGSRETTNASLAACCCSVMYTKTSVRSLAPPSTHCC